MSLGSSLSLAICRSSFVIGLELKMGDIAKANDIENRLIDFAVRVIKFADALPKTQAGKHIGRQLLRSGTSPAPNYAEARGAESNADFVHKLKIALKELNESSVWLKMICRAELMNETRLSPLIDECQQLCRILNASIRTAKQK
jgi:four helix bundle protein